MYKAHCSRSGKRERKKQRFKLADEREKERNKMETL